MLVFTYFVFHKTTYSFFFCMPYLLSSRQPNSRTTHIIHTLLHTYTTRKLDLTTTYTIYTLRNLKIDPRDRSWVARLALQRRSHWPTEPMLVLKTTYSLSLYFTKLHISYPLYHNKFYIRCVRVQYLGYPMYRIRPPSLV
jgi:hypothetical protein